MHQVVQCSNTRLPKYRVPKCSENRRGKSRTCALYRWLRARVGFSLPVALKKMDSVNVGHEDVHARLSL